MKKLFERYDGDKELYLKVVKNLVDLHAVVKQSFIFPVYAYSIKNIAKFLGFKWSAEDAGGAQSMIWYKKWIDTKEEKYLKEVVRYNKEDCLAEVVIKDFIENESK